MKKRTKKHNPSFSFEAGDTTVTFELMPDGDIECSMGEDTSDGRYSGLTCFQDSALDVIANLRQAAAEIERMYLEQEGK